MTDSNTSRRVFLDSGGSAPMHPMTLAALDAARSEGWADPSRLHSEGRAARGLLEASRQAIAEALGARTEEVHFAPSHTSALHTAVRAIARGRRRIGSGIIVSSVERASVLNAAAYAGEVEPVPVDALGRIDLAATTTAIAAPGVALACLQHANGEVGTVQPGAQVHAATRDAGVPLLVDAGASVGHVDVGSAWDALAAHPADWGGPDGIGILVVRGRVRTSRINPADADHWFPGGVSVGAAYAAAVSLQAVLGEQEESNRSRRDLVTHMREQIPRLVPDVDVVGDPADRLPHVLTFSCLYAEGEALLSELDRAGFAVGSGSACTSITLEPSHVLAAMGALTHGNVRVSLHAGITREDVDRFLVALPLAVGRVRESLGVSGL